MNIRYPLKNPWFGLSSSGHLSAIGALLVLMICTGCTTGGGGGRNDDYVARYEQAGRYYNSGLYSDAERVLLELEKRSPNNYDVLFRLGNIYVRTGQFEAAERAYQRCVKIDPSQPKGWYNLSLLRVKQAMYLVEEGRSKSAAQAPEFRANFDRLEQGLMAAIGDGG